MDVRTGPKHRDTGAGFTLVELLLAVALLVLLLGAMVYNFSGLQRGAQLDEGANQLEGLIRFARAHAANSGRLVQINFEEDLGDGFVAPLGNLQVLWEPDPAARPGLFEPLAEAEEYVRRITDLVNIEEVRLAAGNSFEPEPVDASVNSNESPATESDLLTFPPIGFFPDGSSDSAEIILASRAEDDLRRVAVRLQGITGSIRRRHIADESTGVEPEPASSADAPGTAAAIPVAPPDVRK